MLLFPVAKTLGEQCGFHTIEPLQMFVIMDMYCYRTCIKNRKKEILTKR